MTWAPGTPCLALPMARPAEMAQEPLSGCGAPRISLLTQNGPLPALQKFSGGCRHPQSLLPTGHPRSQCAPLKGPVARAHQRQESGGLSF